MSRLRWIKRSRAKGLQACNALQTQRGRGLPLSGKLPLCRGGSLKNTNIVSLGRVRELLAEIDRARAAILSGEIEGIYAVFRHARAGETIYLAGVFKQDTRAATKAMLKLSAHRARTEDEPPLFQQSSL